MSHDITYLLDAINPVRDELPPTPDDDVLERVRSVAIPEITRGFGPLATRRHVGIALILASVLIVPPLAISGTLGSLFGFSAKGVAPTTPVSSSASALLGRVAGAPPDSVRLIATHGDRAFFAARAASGGLCVGVGKADATSIEFSSLRCSDGSLGSFPSETVPVIQQSPVYGESSSEDVYMPELFGFAADGVAEVTIEGPSGRVGSADVVDNVFWAEMPHRPVTTISAYDADGQLIWQQPLTH